MVMSPESEPKASKCDDFSGEKVESMKVVSEGVWDFVDPMRESLKSIIAFCSEK